MKRSIILIPIVISLTGCLSPNLCNTNQSISSKEGLSSEHLQYFEDQPTLSVAEAHGTILPLMHMRQHLQKRSSGFRYVNHVSLLGGLLLEGDTIQNFGEDGKPLPNDYKGASLNMLSGLLFEIKADADMNDLTGSTTKSFLLKAFGSSQDVSGSKYYTILWMPMKF